MGFFAAARQGRKDDAELGRGVWRRAHDRFRRALDRFHQILEGVQDEQLYAEMVPLANELADLLPRVRAVCAAAHSVAPSEGTDIPASKAGYLSEVHRSLSRAGNALATTAQALAMANLASPPRWSSGEEGAYRGPAFDDGAPRGVETGAETGADSVRRRAEAVFEAVRAAERDLRLD